jgi:hypothetical protein
MPHHASAIRYRDNETKVQKMFKSINGDLLGCTVFWLYANVLEKIYGRSP